MKAKAGSLVAFFVVLAGLFWLIYRGYVFSGNPVSLIIRILALGLMLWSRFTFGVRSFHATANTTKGKLITRGPYRWFRHPIYAAIIYFFLGSVIAYPNAETVIAFGLICSGLFARMILE